jgi:hypothetical protein
VLKGDDWDGGRSPSTTQHSAVDCRLMEFNGITCDGSAELFPKSNQVGAIT